MIFASFCRINSVRVVYDRKEVKKVKKKNWKKLMVAALATGIIAGNSQTVFATSDNLMDAILSEDTDNDEITDEETTEDFAEDTSYSLLRGTNLNFGNMKIQRLSSNEIGIYGLTQCHKSCSKVSLVRRMYSAAFVISPVLSLTATILSISASLATVAGVMVTFVFGLLL